MYQRKKRWLLLILVIILISGCFMEKKKDEGKGVSIAREGNVVKVSAKQEFIAGSYILDREVKESDIFTEADKLRIVRIESGKTYIDIVDLDENIKVGDILFTINNCVEFLTVKEKEIIKEKEFRKKEKKIEKRAEQLEELLGDFNNNNEVEVSDFAIFKKNYGTESVIYDIGPAQLGTSEKYSKIYSIRKRDGKVNLLDFLIFGKNYGEKIVGTTISDIKLKPEIKNQIATLEEVKLNTMVIYSDGKEELERVNVTSSDSLILSVTTIGSEIILKGIKQGTAVLKFEKSGIVIIKNVSVINRINKIEIIGAENVGIGESISLTGKISYSDLTTSSDIIWKSSDETLATVDSTGKVIGKKSGIVIISASKDEVTVSKTLEVVALKKEITLYIADSFGDQIYAWDSTSKPLTGVWPGKKLTEKEGSFYVLTFESEIKTVNFLILKGGNKVTGDKVTTSNLWITEDGKEHKENPLKVKPIITLEPNGIVTGETIITIKITSFEDNSATASIENKTIQIAKIGGKFKVSDYLRDKETGIIRVTAVNSIGESNIELSITRDDTIQQIGHPIIPDDKINNTVYQAFYWNSNGGLWNGLKPQIKNFAEIGVTSMWLPPANKAGSGTSDIGYGAYDFWDLGEFNQKGAVATKWGVKEELQDLIKEMHANKIKAYYDVVFNHKLGSDGQETFNGRTAWTKYSGQGRYKYYSKANNWHWNYECFDGDNKGLFPGKTWDVSEDYLMGEDIDYENTNVIDEMKEWGSWVINEIGFDGFRMDAIKHVRNEFVKEWVNHVKETSKKSNIMFIGEAWIGDTTGLKNYLSAVGNSISVFDFPLRGDFVSLSGGGKDLRNWGGVVNSDKSANAITFVDNHDTFRKGNPYNQPQVTRFKNQAYAYILSLDKGVPCIFAKDYEYLAMKTTIDPMITARRYYAYGEAVISQTNDSDTYTIVRKGLPEVPKTGCVVMISDGTSGNITIKSINSFKANKEFYDLSGNITETVKTDANGVGNFKVIQSESKGWSIWVQK
jgi:alpha-amylase